MASATSRVSAAGAGAPPNSVQSDVNYQNTAMGFGVQALASETTASSALGLSAHSRLP
jgi:hypothetical protein